jgi:hypothetical protein
MKIGRVVLRAMNKIEERLSQLPPEVWGTGVVLLESVDQPALARGKESLATRH